MRAKTAQRFPVRWVLPILVAATLPGCATAINAGADFDRDADFDRYTSFAFAEAEGMPTGDPRLDDNPFFTNRLHAAITVEMERRGIRHRDGEADLLVHHHTAVNDHVEVYQADASAGYTTDEYGPGTQIVEYEQGTFLVDIADADTKEILWRGWAIANVESALEDPDEMRELLGRAVAMMFESYPVAPR